VREQDEIRYDRHASAGRECRWYRTLRLSGIFRPWVERECHALDTKCYERYDRAPSAWCRATQVIRVHSRDPRRNPSGVERPAHPEKKLGPVKRSRLRVAQRAPTVLCLRNGRRAERVLPPRPGHVLIHGSNATMKMAPASGCHLGDCRSGVVIRRCGLAAYRCRMCSISATPGLQHTMNWARRPAWALA
jgi:hypothetical protein